jgi:hypothetical protein
MPLLPSKIAALGARAETEIIYNIAPGDIMISSIRVVQL